MIKAYLTCKSCASSVGVPRGGTAVMNNEVRFGDYQADLSLVYMEEQCQTGHAMYGLKWGDGRKTR